MHGLSPEEGLVPEGPTRTGRETCPARFWVISYQKMHRQMFNLTGNFVT
jgi:hypothetical protein